MSTKRETIQKIVENAKRARSSGKKYTAEITISLDAQAAPSKEGGGMTYEEMKTLLRAIGEKRRLLLSTERRLAEAKAEADGLRGGGGVRVSGGVQIPTAQRYVEEIERLERRAAELSAEVGALEGQVEAALRTLSAIEQTVIRDRFFSCKRWRLIQREIGYAEAQPYRIAKKAVKKLAKIVQKPKDDSK